MLASTYSVVGSPGPLKRALKESGLYQSGAENFVKAAQDQQGYELLPASVPADNAQVQKALAGAFPPSAIEAKATNAIDDFYAWVKGDTESLRVTVHIADRQQELASQLSAHAMERAASLPRCPIDRSLYYQSDIDPFSATCLPYGVTPDSVGIWARSQVLSALSSVTVLSNNSDSSYIGSRSLGQQFNMIPTLHARIEQGRYVLGAMSILLVALAIFCSTNRMSTIRRLGIIGLCVGIAGAVLALVGLYAAQVVTDNAVTARATGTLEPKLLQAGHLLLHDIRNWWLGYSLILVAIGGVTLLGAFYKSKRTSGQDTPQTKQKARL